MKPWRASASANNLALPLLPGKAGVHQSRSVGPLPATNITAARASRSRGAVMVPDTGMSMTSQETSSFSIATLLV